MTPKSVVRAACVAVIVAALTAAALLVWIGTGSRSDEDASPEPEVSGALATALPALAGELYAYDTWVWRGDELAAGARGSLLASWDDGAEVTLTHDALDAVDEHAALLGIEPIERSSYRHALRGTRFVTTPTGLAYEVDLDRTWQHVDLADEPDARSGMVDAFRLHLDVEGDRAVVTALEWQPEHGWRD